MKTLIKIWIEESDKAHVTRIAADRKESTSSVIREAIRRFLYPRARK